MATATAGPVAYGAATSMAVPYGSAVPTPPAYPSYPTAAAGPTATACPPVYPSSGAMPMVVASGEWVGGGDVFASESDGSGLYCGVTAKFITPNLNEGNLSMEYVQYPARFSPDPLYAAAVAAVAAVVTYGLYAVWMKRA